MTLSGVYIAILGLITLTIFISVAKCMAILLVAVITLVYL